MDLPRNKFEKLVAEALREFPAERKQKIKNVAVLIEDEPDKETRKEHGLSEDETLLGLYRGIPMTARGSDYGVGPTLPDTITLYRLPIEEEGEGNSEKIKQVIGDTVWHEFAHYFGMDEDAVSLREIKRKKSL